MEQARTVKTIEKSRAFDNILCIIKVQKIKPYELLYFAVFIIYVFTSVKTGDDAWFKRVYKDMFEYNMLDYLEYRLNTWSTRVILEPYMMLLLFFPILFRLSIPLWFVSIAAAVERLLEIKDQRGKWIISGSLLLLSISFTGNVGVVCTTVDYIFPIACFLWAIVPVVEGQRGKKIPIYKYVVSVLLMIVALNMEYYCAPAFLICTFLFIKALKIKKERIISMMLIIISIASTVFVLLSPMNTLNAYKEVSGCIQGYEFIPIWEKVQLALVSTSGGLISTSLHGDTFFVGTFILGMLLAIYGIEKEEKHLYRMLWSIPLLITVISGGIARIVPQNSLWRELFFDTKSGWKGDSISTTIVAIIFFISLILCLLKIDKRLGWFGIVALICRFTMGLSSSILWSGLRTFYPLLFVLCIACGIIIIKTKIYKKIAISIFIIGILVTNIINYVYLFM